MWKSIIEQLLKVLWLFPVKKNRVVFRSSQGAKYNCNPKYISEYLEKNYPGVFEIVWLFNSPERYAFLNNRGIICCRNNSIKGIFYTVTSKILVDNHGVQSYIPIRKNQVVINTWHGGGSYKKPYTNRTKQHIKYVSKMSLKTTKYLSSCKRFSECNLSGTSRKFPEKIMPTGMPRNDLFFADHSELSSLVKQRLGIDETKKIVLYAPTFRDNVSDEDFELDAAKITEACKLRFGGDFTLGIRFHQFTKRKNHNPDEAFDANSYEDMQELIYASDVVITDYSSLIWDVSIAGKPCFIYATDLKKYMQDRDFYTPISEWPFPLAEDQTQLIENIVSFDSDKYQMAICHHHEQLGSYERGTACKQVADYFYSIVYGDNKKG